MYVFLLFQTIRNHMHAVVLTPLPLPTPHHSYPHLLSIPLNASSRNILP